MSLYDAIAGRTPDETRARDRVIEIVDLIDELIADALTAPEVIRNKTLIKRAETLLRYVKGGRMSFEEYAEAGATTCPVCWSEESVVGGTFDTAEETSQIAFRQCRCDTCNALWVEKFVIVEIEDISVRSD